MYNNTVYVLGQSRTNNDNAITMQFNSFFIGFIINVETDEIVDLGCSHTIDVTEKFLRYLLLGKIITADYDKFEKEIIMRYHGSSQKAILVSYKEALNQYLKIKQKYFLS